MDNIKTFLIGALVVITGFLGVAYFNQPAQNVGAIPGTSIDGNEFSVNGITTFSKKLPNLAQATTTVCAIKSPNATSTLVVGAVRFTVSSTTASTVTLAKAATAYATTTALGSASISANAQGTVVSEKTAAGGDGLDETFGPNQWFVVGMQGGVGTFSPTGVCQATFQQI